MEELSEYDTKFRCEYRQRTDEEQDDAYRNDLLRAFRLKEWNGDAISGTLDRLFARLQSMPGAGTLIENLRKKYPQIQLLSGDDDRTLFQILFCFDLFDKTHATICDMLEKGEMSDEGLAALSENVV